VSTKQDQKILEFQKRLGYAFRKPELLREAVTHKSFLNEARDADEKDNERLEFLGDSVLDLAVSERLCTIYPASPEGELSKMKSRIVSERALARVGSKLELGRYLVLGKGEEMTGGREKPSLLADALEAVIAAVYRDGGFEAARNFILDTFSEEFASLALGKGGVDYKTELQEYCQREYDTLPRYQVLSESGPDHAKIFEVQINIRSRSAGTGKGRSKKEAEQQAAKKALEKLRKMA
jgi:ribonuclease-3